MAGDNDVIVVEDRGGTRANATRAGRVSTAPRCLEHEASDVAARKGDKTNVAARKGALEKTHANTPEGNGNTKVGPILLEAIQNLAKTTTQRLDQQGKLIELIEAQFKVIRDEQEATNARLEQRLNVLATTLDSVVTQLTTRLDQLGTQVTTATGTYADALKSGLTSANTGIATATTSQGTPILQICSINPSSSASRQDAASGPHVIINIAQAEQRQILAAEKPGKIRRWIDEALQGQDATKEVKCDSISRSVRDSNKFKVFFKDESTVLVVRENKSWLQERFRGTRVQAEQWYPIRVDSVYKGGVLAIMEGTDVKPDAAQMVAEENEVQVHKLQWLSKPDNNKIHGSMVMYLGR